jgi:hypothetical protein
VTGYTEVTSGRPNRACFRFLLMRQLRNLLSRIADHPIKRIEELLPWNVAASLKLPIRQAV